MKHLKKYESIEDPEVGDYVVINSDLNRDRPTEIIKYITTHIGQIISQDGNWFTIKYNNSPKINGIFDEALRTGWMLSDEEIDFFSKNKKEAKIYIASKKYNL